MFEDDGLDRRFAAGEAAAVCEAYERHGRLVFSLCLTALRSREDAEDAAQQVFTRAWRSRDTYDPARPLGGWLTGITRRVIADMFAGRARDARKMEAEVVHLPRAEGAEDAVSDAVVAAVVVHDALALLGRPRTRCCASPSWRTWRTSRSPSASTCRSAPSVPTSIAAWPH